MTRNKVKSLMMQVFKTDSVSDSITQKDCAEWDSLKHLALAVSIEETFGIFLEPDEIEQMISLDAIVNLVEQKQNN